MFLKLAPDQRSLMRMEVDPRPGQAGPRQARPWETTSTRRSTSKTSNPPPPPPQSPPAAALHFQTCLVFLDGSHICKRKAIGEMMLANNHLRRNKSSERLVDLSELNWSWLLSGLCSAHCVRRPYHCAAVSSRCCASRSCTACVCVCVFAN